MFSIQRCFKTNQEFVRGTSNLLVEKIWSTVVFKIDVFFVSLKGEMADKSVSKIQESLPLKNVNTSNVVEKNWSFV